MSQRPNRPGATYRRPAAVDPEEETLRVLLSLHEEEAEDPGAEGLAGADPLAALRQEAPEPAAQGGEVRLALPHQAGQALRQHHALGLVPHPLHGGLTISAHAVPHVANAESGSVFTDEEKLAGGGPAGLDAALRAQEGERVPQVVPEQEEEDTPQLALNGLPISAAATATNGGLGAHLLRQQHLREEAGAQLDAPGAQGRADPREEGRDAGGAGSEGRARHAGEGDLRGVGGAPHQASALQDGAAQGGGGGADEGGAVLLNGHSHAAPQDSVHYGQAGRTTPELDALTPVPADIQARHEQAIRALFPHDVFNNTGLLETPLLIDYEHWRQNQNQ